MFNDTRIIISPEGIIHNIKTDNLIFFVGAFGPFHVAHFEKAQLSSLYLNAPVIIVPVREIPMKPDVMPYYTRISIIKQSIREFKLGYVLLENDGLNSDNFMHILRDKYNLFSIVGIDSFCGIPYLPCGKDLLTYTHILVFEREGYEQLENCIPNDFTRLEEITRLPIKEEYIINVIKVWKNPISNRYIIYMKSQVSLSSRRILEMCAERTDDNIRKNFVNDESYSEYLKYIKNLRRGVKD